MPSHHLKDEENMKNEAFKTESNETRLQKGPIRYSDPKSRSALLREIRREVRRALG